MKKLSVLQAAAVLVALAVMVSPAVAQKSKTSEGRPAKVNAAVSSPTPLAGTLPMFADAQGNLSVSTVYQDTNTGNIGVGTSSPGAALDIVAPNGGANTSSVIESYGSADSGASPNSTYFAAQGTASSPLPVAQGQNLGQFDFFGFDGTNQASPSNAKMWAYATEAHSAGHHGTALQFDTTLNGTTTHVPRLTIDNTGYVGIGTSAPAYPLTVNGAIQSTGGYVFPDGSTQSTAQVAGPQGPQGPKGSAGPQGATGPVGPAGVGGLTVKDANGNVLGVLLSITPNNPALGFFSVYSQPILTIYTKGTNGQTYYTNLGLNGQFLPASVAWSGQSCIGTPYLTDVRASSSAPGFSFTNWVVFDLANNELMTGVSNQQVMESVKATVQSFDGGGSFGGNGGSPCGGLVKNTSLQGFQQQVLDPATALGWSVSGSPLSVAGPLQIN